MWCSDVTCGLMARALPLLGGTGNRLRQHVQAAFWKPVAQQTMDYLRLRSSVTSLQQGHSRDLCIWPQWGGAQAC